MPYKLDVSTTLYVNVGNKNKEKAIYKGRGRRHSNVVVGMRRRRRVLAFRRKLITNWQSYPDIVL